MNRSTVSLAALTLTIFASCGVVPKEVNYYLRQFGAMCDLVFKDGCLTPQQRSELQVGFYFGSNAAECRAVYDEVLADSAARSTFANRNLDETQANACVEAVTKLTCDDLKKMFSNLMTIPSAYDGDMTLAKNARTALGFPDGYKCVTEQGNCLAEPACNLTIPTGPCATFKVAPKKDPTLKAKEITDNAAPGAANAGCGFPPFSAAFTN
jgi:hypothetical protein